MDATSLTAVNRTLPAAVASAGPSRLHLLGVPLPDGPRAHGPRRLLTR
jgi:hypothetical protein